MKNNILEKFYLLKQNNFLEIERELITKAKEENAVIYCKKKCYYCCNSYLIGPEIEIELIYHFLQKSNFLRDKFLKNYKKWKKKIDRIDNVISEIEKLVPIISNNQGTPAQHKKYFELITKFNKEKIFCPLLYKKECLIYPVRPYVCANICSFTPQKYCKLLSPKRDIKTSTIPPSIPKTKEKLNFKTIIPALIKKLNPNNAVTLFGSGK